MTMTERHFEIIEILDRRRNESISNLAFLFNVSTRTIRTDIEILSLRFPLYTKPGIHGGVFLMEGFSLNKRYLTDIQKFTLEKILEILDDESKYIVTGIIKEFSRRTRKIRQTKMDNNLYYPISPCRSSSRT